MDTILVRRRTWLALAAASASAAGTAWSQAAAARYPDHPIRMVVAWAPGGGTDSAARIVARYLGDRLGQPVVVDNKPGASGIVGTEFVSRAVPDGYTLQYTVADSHSINPHVFVKVPYDALRDFTPVALVGSMPNSLIVNPRVKAGSVAEFVKLAKSEPGRLTFSSWGVGSGGHIRMAAFEGVTGTRLLHVPYNGSGPALAAVMAGDVDAMMAPYGLAESSAKAGKVRVLSIDTAQRAPFAPGIPTFAEQGVPINLSFWQGVLAPAKTPQPVIDRLRAEMTQVLADPRVLADLQRVGVTVGLPGTETLDATRAYFRSEFTRWGEVVRDAGIKPE